MRTYWFCANCNVNGSVQHAHDADVYSVIQLLRRAHAKRADPVECDLQSSAIHVIFPKGRPRAAKV